MAARKGAAGRPGRVVQRQAAGDGVRTQLRQVRRDGWAQKDRARFLAELAETCNVSEAARTVGKSRQAAYGLKQRDAEFARDWDAAIEQGYGEIEAMLIRLALHGCESEEIIEDGEGHRQAKGRTSYQAPEVDGNVYIDNPGDLKPGDFVHVHIIDGYAYDLIAEVKE